MLTENEKEFIDYWKHNRLQKKKVLKQLSVGLPLGVLLVIAIFINFFSGWDKRAQMIINSDPSLIIVLLVASILIVIFIVIFSAHHRWDLNEQRYRELCARQQQD
jgi:membrane protein YdbS with pleckstrin-like domain